MPKESGYTNIIISLTIFLIILLYLSYVEIFSLKQTKEKITLCRILGIIFLFVSFLLYDMHLFFTILLWALTIGIFFYPNIYRCLIHKKIISYRSNQNITSQTSYHSIAGNHRPIDPDSEQDDFDRTEYVKHIAAMVISEPTKKMVYGINGKWGVGKTSLMRLVFKHIQQEYKDSCLQLSFNSWNYRTPNKVVENLLINIRNAIDPHVKSVKFKYYMSHISNYIASFSVGGLSLSLDKIFIPDTVGIKEITDILEKEFQLQLVVFVDDLDRLERGELRGVLIAIGLLSELPKIKFVLAYDREIISDLLFRNDKIIATEYMAKIIQHEFYLASPDESTKKKVLEDIFQKYFFKSSEPFDSLIAKEEQYALFYLLSTPREIKRVAAACYSILESNNITLHWKDLFFLTVLQYRIPSLYAWLIENEHEVREILNILHGIPSTILIDLRREDAGEYFIKRAISAVPKKQKAVAEIILEHFINEGGDKYPDTLKNKRLKNPSVYITYFTYKSSAEQRDALLIEQDVDAMKSDNNISGSVTKYIEDNYYRLSTLGLWDIFYNSIIEKIEPIKICESIAKASAKIDGGKNFPGGFSVRSDFCSLVYGILYKQQNDKKEEVIETLINCIKGATSYGFSAYLATASISPEHFSLTRIISIKEEDKNKIEKAFDERFKSYKRDNTKLLPDNDFFDFVAIVSWTNLSSEDVQKIHEEIKAEPRQLINILSVFVGVSDLGHVIYNNLKSLDEKLNCQKLYDLYEQNQNILNIKERPEEAMIKALKEYVGKIRP